MSVEKEVEAALLNSEGEPIQEARAALAVLAKFARHEIGVPEGMFVEMARVAWHEAGE